MEVYGVGRDSRTVHLLGGVCITLPEGAVWRREENIFQFLMPAERPPGYRDGRFEMDDRTKAVWQLEMMGTMVDASEEDLPPEVFHAAFPLFVDALMSSFRLSPEEGGPEGSAYTVRVKGIQIDGVMQNVDTGNTVHVLLSNGPVSETSVQTQQSPDGRRKDTYINLKVQKEPYVVVGDTDGRMVMLMECKMNFGGPMSLYEVYAAVDCCPAICLFRGVPEVGAKDPEFLKRTVVPVLQTLYWDSDLAEDEDEEDGDEDEEDEDDEDGGEEDA